MAQTAEVEVAPKRRFRRDEGASLVEFALIAPVLFLLIFGIIEFGWVFGQHLDVRHGAREGSRLIAVNDGQDDLLSGAAQSNAIVADICQRMDLPGNPTIELQYIDAASGAETTTAQAVGEFAIVRVTNDVHTLTGFLDFALKPLGTEELESEVQTRLERGVEVGNTDYATWAAGSYTCP